MELNIGNLIDMYKRAKKENKDIKGFFNIRSEEDAQNVLTPPLNFRIKKQKLRIIFEEICYTTKITFPDVNTYLNMLQKRIDDI